MKKKVSIVIIKCFFLSLLCFPNGPAMAEGLRFGNLDISPGLKLQEVYDDNIFLDNEGEESDWITHVIPSMLLTYTIPQRGNIGLGYEGDLAYYGKHDDNNWASHRGLFDLDYEAPVGLILGIHNAYLDTEDPYGSENDYKLGVPQTARWSNDLSARAGYAFSNRFKVLAFYNYYKQDYDLREDFTQDFETNELGAGFRMRLLAKTWGFVRYHFGERDYFTHPAGSGVTESNDADSDWRRINAGLTWDSTAKLSGELNFGYQWRDYDNPTDANGRPYEEKDTWIASTLVSFEATPTSTLTLTIMRALRESGSNTSEFFVDTGAGLNLRQAIFEKFTLNMGVTYSQNDYEEYQDGSRKDDNYQGNIALDYMFRDWLGAGIGYEFKKKDSDNEEFEYTDNRFLISLRFVY